MAKPYIEIMVGDPRYNYYFYHQSGEIYAREHGDSGPPVAADYPKLTVHGLYPVGGKYNDGTTGSTNPNMGAAVMEQVSFLPMLYNLSLQKLNLC